MLSQGRVLGRYVTLSWWRAFIGQAMQTSCFFLPLYWELYITSTETILLTVWSRSLLTRSLNRRRDYNKQGQSKSNPPSTRCRFGKLYPGKWSFLKPFVVILLIISLDHASKFIFSSPQSPNSPVISIHSGYHLKNKGQRDAQQVAISVLVMSSLRESISAIPPYCVSLESSISVNTRILYENGSL